MKPTKRQEAIGACTDALLNAASAYHDALCKWNGDEDGPLEKADDAFHDACSEAIEELISHFEE